MDVCPGGRYAEQHLKMVMEDGVSQGEHVYIKLEVLDAFPGMDRDDALLTLKQHQLLCCSIESMYSVETKGPKEKEEETTG